MSKLLTFLIALAIGIGFVLGFWWVIAAVYNAVAPAIGLPKLGYWVIAGICFLIGCVGSCFRSTPKEKSK